MLLNLYPKASKDWANHTKRHSPTWGSTDRTQVNQIIILPGGLITRTLGNTKVLFPIVDL